jgi:hypothetical protein
MGLIALVKTAAGRLALRVAALRVEGGSTTNNTLVYDESENAYIPGPGGGGGGSDDQTASEVPFTPTGSIAATNVQTAIAELDSETTTALAGKASTATTMTAGAGLTGGGSLAINRTFAVGAGTGITVNADDIAVNYGTSGTTACVGNDSRLSDDRTASGLRSATTVISVSAATAPTAGQVLKATSSTTATWQAESAGSDFTTPITVTIADSLSPDINVLETLTARSIADPGPGFGAAIRFELDNDNAPHDIVTAAQVEAAWSDPTSGSESSEIRFRTRLSGGALTIQWKIADDGSLEAVGSARRIKSVADPINASDAATKNYVDGQKAPIGGPYYTYAATSELTAERFIGALTVTANFEASNTTTTALGVTQIASQSVPLFYIQRNDGVQAWRVTSSFQFESAIPGAQQWTKTAGGLGMGTGDNNPFYVYTNANTQLEIQPTFATFLSPALFGGTPFTDTPASCASIEARAVEKGILVNRMTTTQQGNIPSPTNGLIHYNTTTSRFVGRYSSSFVPFTDDTRAAPVLVVFGNTATASTPTTEYLDPWGGGRAATVNEAFFQVTSPGKFAKLRVRARTGPTGDGITITVRKNGTNQSLTLTLGAGSTTASDLSNSFTVIAGDDISVSAVGGASISAGAADLYVSMEFTLS